MVSEAIGERFCGIVGVPFDHLTGVAVNDFKSFARSAAKSIPASRR